MQRVKTEYIDTCDIPQLALLEMRNFSDGWNENMLRSHFENNNSIQLKITSADNIIIGYLITSSVLDEINIDIIAVDKPYRGQGYADLLLNQLEEKIKVNTNIIMLEVREKNLPARALYKKNGFEEVGRRNNYYSSPQDNAILMNKLL